MDEVKKGDTKDVFLAGGPGTGKTILAVETAKILAAQCYKRHNIKPQFIVINMGRGETLIRSMESLYFKDFQHSAAVGDIEYIATEEEFRKRFGVPHKLKNSLHKLDLACTKLNKPLHSQQTKHLNMACGKLVQSRLTSEVNAVNHLVDEVKNIVHKLDMAPIYVEHNQSPVACDAVKNLVDIVKNSVDAIKNSAKSLKNDADVFNNSVAALKDSVDKLDVSLANLGPTMATNPIIVLADEVDTEHLDGGTTHDCTTYKYMTTGHTHAFDTSKYTNIHLVVGISPHIPSGRLDTFSVTLPPPTKGLVSKQLCSPYRNCQQIIKLLEFLSQHALAYYVDSNTRHLDTSRDIHNPSMLPQGRLPLYITCWDYRQADTVIQHIKVGAAGQKVGVICGAYCSSRAAHGCVQWNTVAGCEWRTVVVNVNSGGGGCLRECVSRAREDLYFVVGTEDDSYYSHMAGAHTQGRNCRKRPCPYVGDTLVRKLDADTYLSQPATNTTTPQPGTTTTSQPGTTTISQNGTTSTTSQPGATTTSQVGSTTKSQPETTAT